MTRWSRLRQTFWFLPALLCLAAVVLAECLVYLDRRLGDLLLDSPVALLTEVGEAGSRDLLGAIAGSMLTVASTTFSITIAVLALSSSTYGPRLVRNFMADRGNQLVLGIFVATFLYCLMVLRSIRVVSDGGNDYFVPHVAVNVAVLLAVVSIGVLVYFIHHISDSVQVWTLAALVRADLLSAVDRLYPAGGGRDARTTPQAPEAQDAPSTWSDAAAVRSAGTGYVQGVDVDGLVSLATDRGLVVRLHVRPGAYVVEGAVLLLVRPPGRLDEDAVAGLRATVRLGRARTPDQDVEFPVLLLEEMAVRALSPGTNDPYTAINALDNLASGLAALASRPVPSPYRYDEDGQLRVVAPRDSVMDLLDHVLDAMRVYAVTHPTVLHRSLDLIEQVGANSEDPEVHRALDRHGRHLVDSFAATSPHPRDLVAMSRHVDEARTGPSRARQ